jgi:hypothetical protein
MIYDVRVHLCTFNGIALLSFIGPYHSHSLLALAFAFVNKLNERSDASLPSMQTKTGQLCCFLLTY